MRIFVVVVAFFLTICASGCTSYDAFREKTILDLKESHIKVVTRAKEGKLSDVEFRSSLKTYDDAVLDERAKSGSGLKELQESSSKASDEATKKLFP